jgi:hypothetical protein
MSHLRIRGVRTKDTIAIALCFQLKKVEKNLFIPVKTFGEEAHKIPGL